MGWFDTVEGSLWAEVDGFAFWAGFEASGPIRVGVEDIVGFSGRVSEINCEARVWFGDIWLLVSLSTLFPDGTVWR